MEIRRLQYFLHIADAGSISKAATALGIAQPALSRQLATLEAELRTQLFERSASGIRLTPAGETLYARAQAIVRQVASLRLEMGADPGAVSGLVAIGLAPSHELYLGPPLVAQAMERYPKLRLQISVVGSVITQLQAGAVDIAVGPGDPADPAIAAEPLLREDMLLIQAAGAPPPPTDLPSLAALPWIVTRAQSAVHGTLGSLFTQTELEPKVVAEINSLPLVLYAVQLGMGVSLLSRTAAAQAAASGQVTAWPIGDPPLRRNIWLCVRRRPPPSTRIAAVAQLIREIVAEKMRTDAARGSDPPLIHPPEDAPACPIGA